MRYIPTNLLAVAYVLSVALVTAAVTFDGGTRVANALRGVNGPGTHQAVLLNTRTGALHPYMRKVWPSMATCEAAIQGLNARLVSIAKLDPNDQMTVAVSAPNADPELAGSLDQLVVHIVMTEGLIPSFSISCEPKADPV